MPAKLSLDQIRDGAKERGGLCLSGSYHNNRTPMLWRCLAGHEWLATAHHVLISKSWCPVCAHRIPLTLKDAQDVAQVQQGACLSMELVPGKKLDWKCQFGHTWAANLDAVRNGTWCPCCSGKNRTIEDMERIAVARGGHCLSSIYVAHNVRLTWQCSKGHQWGQIPRIVLKGIWCPQCEGRGVTIEALRVQARSRGGICLSDSYSPRGERPLWQCSNGHTWRASPLRARYVWCSECSRDKTNDPVNVHVRLWTIYTLEDPRSGDVRYVGVTHQKMRVRYAQHLELARKSPRYHLANWVRSLLANGVQPLMVPVEVGSGEGWGEAETKWIKHFRELHCDLVNATNGGEGCPGHSVSAEARERIRQAHLGKPLSAAHRAKVAAGNRGKKMSPEAIEKTAAFWRGRKHRPESRAKISLALRGKSRRAPTSEVLARRGAAIRAAFAAPDWVSPWLGRHQSTETKAKISAANRGRKRSPESCTKISAARRKREAERAVAT